MSRAIRSGLTVTQAWAQLDASKGTIASAQSQVKAAESALNGVREEARLGQRTTLDVLNAQQELVNARVALVSAQRDRVVNSYSVLSVGGASVARGAGPPGRDLRLASALPSGARCVDRCENARRPLIERNRPKSVDREPGRRA